MTDIRIGTKPLKGTPIGADTLLGLDSISPNDDVRFTFSSISSFVLLDIGNVVAGISDGFMSKEDKTKLDLYPAATPGNNKVLTSDGAGLLVFVDQSTLGGDMLKTVYDTGDNGQCDIADKADRITADPGNLKVYVTDAGGNQGFIDQSALPNAVVSGSDNFLTGLEMSNNAGDALKDLDIAIGQANSIDNTTLGDLTAPLGKQIDATWADGGIPGTTVGGRAAGVSLSASTSYHVILLIKPSGICNAGFDTSVTGANLLADAAVIAAGYTKARRIGSVWVDAGTDIFPFKQTGDRIDIDSTDAEYELTVVTPALTLTNTTFAGLPEGVEAEVLLQGAISGASGTSGQINWFNPDVANPEASNFRCFGSYTTVTGSGIDGFDATVLCNISRQVAYIASVSVTNLETAVVGYIDRRGK